MNVRLTQEQKIKVLNSADIYAIMQQVLLRENKIRRSQEHFWVVGLNHNNKILFVELIGLGASNRVNADPPDVFRMAIYKLAGKLILVHNHPSGSHEVTDADITFTDHMLKAGKLIKVEVLDHLVITETHYTSFADQGVMDELKKNGLFEIMGPERQELEQFKIDTEKKRAKKENSLEIAKKMKAKGYDDATIKELTGLSLKVIGGI
ncbi:JAB domain-containing protein [Flagellimonas halotolerans]|uniref:JAB domain-containing protein n=1 Tax=Flagellimonas halotolerans TaxID=3112164 RepID=A0ABU6IMT2_9FLAO|nr:MULTISPECIES: JAB domain-containing protein [unclassified Allomuricauda]MEC3964547.1 JAB domain-containing protein [Muricauda sp. SYSU M86414]MEC4264416.1 JAB domain-containing protein [Muricauda sp. SYSU M84420]